VEGHPTRTDMALRSIKCSDCGYKSTMSLQIHPGDLSELAASIIEAAN
jgi:hypothetical protein